MITISFISSLTILIFCHHSITIKADAYVQCIKLFCNYHFHSEHALKGSLVIMNVTPDPTPFQSRIIKSLNEDAGHEFSVMIKDSRKRHMNASHVSEKAQNYFMFITTAADVNSTVHQWHALPTWNPLAQVMVLFTESYSNATTMELHTRNVFEQLLGHGMLNVNVMAHMDGTDFVEMLTWYPYADGNCAHEIRNLVVMDKCEYPAAAPITDVDDSISSNSSSTVSNEMFGGELEVVNEEEGADESATTTTVHYRPNKKIPKIPLSLHMCPLTVSASVFEPYTYYEFETDTWTKGIEVLLVHTIAKVLRLRPIFVRVNESRENRVVERLSPGYENLVSGYVGRGPSVVKHYVD